MSLRIWVSASALLALAGCANPPMLLKTTVTGGDAYPKVKIDAAGQPDLSGLNVGDTVVVAPGSMLSVVASPAVNVLLYEPGSDTRDAIEKSVTSGRGEGAKIEVMKGKLLHGDIFVQDIGIDLHSTDLDKYDISLEMLAFNRGEKAFRGDLAIYDLLPPELVFKSTLPAVKYNDHRARKELLGNIPVVSWFASGLDNFSRTSETVDMLHENLGEIHKYTFRRLVLDPGQAVGFTLKLRYLPPSGEELMELRQAARPLTTTFEK